MLATCVRFVIIFEYMIPGEGGLIQCAGSGADLTATLAACQSLKKK